MQCTDAPSRGRMLSLDQLSLLVKEHLGTYNCTEGIQHQNKWIVAESPLGGRGLVATEDIMTGDVLYVDHPLVQGPRSGVSVPHGCTVCSKLPVDMDSELFIKCSKCGLLLCSEMCQNNIIHSDDCAIISRWNKNVRIEEVDDAALSRALTAIRALVLTEDQKLLLTHLEAHMLDSHGSEVRDLEKFFDIPEDDVKLMTLAACALDTNAFQIATPYGKKQASNRGLYPVAGLMNHSCVPNTRYNFNTEAQMAVKAVKPIRAGTEISTCYTGFLWGTPARRTHLNKTKHFWCKCDRCADPTERGTLLGALKCFKTDCPGSLLPVEPLRTTSPWKCLQCDMRVPHQNISTVQNALGSMLKAVDFRTVDELENFLLNRIAKFIPKTNQINVDLQCCLIWELGEAEGLRWQELSEPRLALKESLCRGTLRTLAALGAGDAHLRGLLLYHLHAALAERARRSPDLYEELRAEIESTIEQAYNILQGGVSAPPDLELRRRYLGPGSDKPKEERFFILDP